MNMNLNYIKSQKANAQAITRIKSSIAKNPEIEEFKTLIYAELNKARKAGEIETDSIYDAMLCIETAHTNYLLK